MTCDVEASVYEVEANENEKVKIPSLTYMNFKFKSGSRFAFTNFLGKIKKEMEMFMEVPPTEELEQTN